MSIQQVSNNRPSGSTAKACDAGIPIVGRTSSTGVYEILKVNADGSLSTGGQPITTVPYATTPTAYALAPVGAKGVGVIVYYDTISVTALTAGLYAINPFYLVDTLTANGNVNFILIKRGSTLDAYTSGRNVGVDAFQPVISDFTTGYSCFWHSNPLQILSSVGAQSTGMLNATRKEVYLEAGVYALCIEVETTFTTASPTTYIGFSEFTKIA